MRAHFPRFAGCDDVSPPQYRYISSYAGSIKKYRLDKNQKRIDDTDYELLNEPNYNKQYNNAKTAFVNQLGCRLIGSFTVKEVPGNFHISGHPYGGVYQRLVQENVISHLDASHKINQLHFGEVGNINTIYEKHPEASLAPLNNRSVNLENPEKQGYTSHYHLDIVPTIYRDGYFSDTRAYQFTYNHNNFPIKHMAVVYFDFHVGGLTVEVKAEDSSLPNFLVHLCAIIGGIYTLANFVDNFLHAIFGGKKEYQLIN